MTRWTQDLVGLGYPLAFEGIVTTATDTANFSALALAGWGDDYFQDYYVYVVWDAGGSGVAPQSEWKPISSYTSSTGAFTHTVFTAQLALTDKVLIIHPSIANALDVYADWEDGGRLDLIIDAILTAITGAISSTPTAKSLQDILHKNTSYTYSKTTDSLEALRDRLDAINSAFGDIVTKNEAGVVDSIWDELLTSNHNIATSAGRRLRAAGIDATLVRENTCQSDSTASTVKLDAAASGTANFYDHMWIYIVDGTGAGQVRSIHDYDEETKIATISPDWIAIPTDDSEFIIIAKASVHVHELDQPALDQVNAQVDSALSDYAGALASVLEDAMQKVSSSYNQDTDSLEALREAIDVIDGIVDTITGRVTAAVATATALTAAKSVIDAIKTILDTPANFKATGFATETKQNVIDGYHDVPGQDSATDAQMRDVIGKKSDTIGGNSIIALIKILTAAIPTVGEIQTEMEQDGQSLLDTIRDELANGADGLTALKTAIDAIGGGGFTHTDWKDSFSFTTGYGTTETDISALFSPTLALDVRRKYSVYLDLTAVEADGSFDELYIAVKKKIDGTNYRAIDRKTVTKAQIAATAEPGIIIKIPATSENIQITMKMKTQLAANRLIYYAVVREHLE